jgi:beta-lactamase class A
MRAALRAGSMRGGHDVPLSRFQFSVPWPFAFFSAVCLVLVAVVYLCATLARALAPEAAASPVEQRPFARANPGGSTQDITATGSHVEQADDALETAIQGALADHPEAASVAVLDLADGRWAAHDADRVRYAASTFKLAVLYEVERRVSDGELAYEDRLLIDDEAVAEDLGTLERVPVAEDGTVSIGEALDAMITLSDNATAVALLRHVGPGAVDESLRRIGLTEMSVNTAELPATAAELALLMRAIVTGEGVSSAQRDHMRELLLAQTVRSGIPAAMIAEEGVGLGIGNKTGTWPGITNDVAFVEGPEATYVIAVMAEGDWNWKLVSDVSRAVYEVMAAR